MARPKTYKKPLDERFRISLPELRKEGYLRDGRSGSFTWYAGDHAVATVKLHVLLDESASGWLLLGYEHESGPLRQQFQLIQQPSNLGRGGGIWYVVCPLTKRLCRTLYLDQSSFVSRWAIKGALYRDQQMSKSDREFSRSLRRLKQLQQLIRQTTDWLGKPRSKRTYQGKLTRSMQRYLRLRTANKQSQCEN